MTVPLRKARGSRARAWLAAAAVVLSCVLGLAQQAAAATSRTYRAQVFPGPSGSRTGFFAISDDGTAAGQQLRADGSSHAVLLSGRRSGGRSPLAGRQSAFVAIDSNDEIVGTLFGAGGTMNPLFFSNGQPKVLPLAGAANGVALGPLVSLTATGADGQQHVFIWNPVSGALRDLGPGLARGINADGVVVGRTLAGNAAYWSADGALHDLGFPGFLIRINLFGRVVGISTQSGGPTPIVLDLSQPSVVTPLALPRGYRFGSAKGLADNGMIVGTAYKKAAGGFPSLGIMWASPTRPVPLAQLVRGRLPRGSVISDGASVDDNGLIVGALTTAAGRRASTAKAGAIEQALLMTPLFIHKVANVLGSLVRRLDEIIGEGGAVAVTQNLGLLLDGAGTDVAAGRLRDACNSLEAAHTEIERLAVGATNPPYTGPDFAQWKTDGVGSVNELKAELDCRGLFGI